jgi:tripartite-type tricarboxylate transporter receptor subunit TctC
MKQIRNLLKVSLGIGVVSALVAGWVGHVGAAESAKFPVKPVTVYNSSTAGSPADVMARQVAQSAKNFLSQPMVVINKTGGSGGVMFAAMMADPADGYTISTVTSGLITALHGELKKNFSIDQFEFIANIQQEPFCFAVKSDSPLKTLKEMIEFAKKNPRLKIGGQGTLTAQHLMVLAMADAADMPVSYVPFSGGAEVLTSLLGGHVPVVHTSPATADQYVEAGKMRILGVSGTKRLPQWPNVPTLRELGYDIVITQYRGFMARKGLPAEVKTTLVNAIKKAVAEPGFKDYMAKNSQQDAFMGPEEFTKVVLADHDYMGKLMRKLVK